MCRDVHTHTYTQREAHTDMHADTHRHTERSVYRDMHTDTQREAHTG